jgi:hypothetical protein
MDMATTKGGTLASIPARLLHGKGVGREAFPQRGVSAAQDIIRIIGSSLHPFGRGRLVSLSVTTRATKLSPCNSLLQGSRTHRHVYSRNCGLLARMMRRRDENAATGSLRRAGG